MCSPALVGLVFTRVYPYDVSSFAGGLRPQACAFAASPGGVAAACAGRGGPGRLTAGLLIGRTKHSQRGHVQLGRRRRKHWMLTSPDASGIPHSSFRASENPVVANGASDGALASYLPPEAARRPDSSRLQAWSLRHPRRYLNNLAISVPRRSGCDTFGRVKVAPGSAPAQRRAGWCLRPGSGGSLGVTHPVTDTPDMGPRAMACPLHPTWRVGTPAPACCSGA